MSRTAWLAARLAGYLWGWQTLLDSGCVCECVGGWEGVCVFVWHHSVPTPGLCTWPVVRVLPPAFSLPRKEQPRRQPAPPRSKRASRAERGPRPNAKSTEEPSVSASHSSVSASLPSEVPSSQWETQCTIVLAVSIFFQKEKSLLPSLHSWSCAARWPPADTLSLLLFFSHPGFDHVTMWLVGRKVLPRWLLHQLPVGVQVAERNGHMWLFFPVIRSIRCRFPSPKKHFF